LEISFLKFELQPEILAKLQRPALYSSADLCVHSRQPNIETGINITWCTCSLANCC